MHPRLPLRPLVPSAEPGVFESSDDSAVQELMLVPCEGMAWRTNPKVSTAAMSFVYFLRRMVSNLVMNPKLLQTFTNNFSTWAWQHGHCPSCDGSGMLWRNSNLVPFWKLVRVLATEQPGFLIYKSAPNVPFNRLRWLNKAENSA